MQNKVFISYSSIDASITREICRYFESKGVECWCAEKKECILPGEDYAEAIAKAIYECKIFIVVTSNNSIKSEQVKKELALANSRINYGLKIFSIIIDSTLLPNELGPSFNYYLCNVQSMYWDKYTERDILTKTILNCLYDQSEDTEDLDNIYNMALQYYRNREYKLAINLMKESANAGNAKAAYDLAGMYQNSFDEELIKYTNMDLKEAEKWCIQAIKAGISSAQILLEDISKKMEFEEEKEQIMKLLKKWGNSRKCYECVEEYLNKAQVDARIRLMKVVDVCLKNFEKKDYQKSGIGAVLLTDSGLYKVVKYFHVENYDNDNFKQIYFTLMAVLHVKIYNASCIKFIRCAGKKIYPNDLCPCGSGKPLKRCCLVK